MTPPPPPKYSQKFNTQKIFIFLKTPKYIKIQNFEPPSPQNNQSLRMYENYRVTPWGDSLPISLSLQPLTMSVMPSKRKAAGKSKQSPDPRARLSPVPSPVACPVISDDFQFKLQIHNLKSLDIIHDALH